MTRDEATARADVFRAMFDAYGVKPARPRLRALIDYTRHLPLELLEPAVKRAACSKASDFPPVPGEIVHAAVALAKAAGAYLPNERRPEWLRLTQQERPRRAR